jgi:hypothetical protein
MSNMRVYAGIDLTQENSSDKIKLFNECNEAFIWFENYVNARETDPDVVDEYIDKLNYKDKVFLIIKDFNPGYYQSSDDFLKFTFLMDSLGLDTQTAIKMFIKKCLAPVQLLWARRWNRGWMRPAKSTRLGKS